MGNSSKKIYYLVKQEDIILIKLNVKNDKYILYKSKAIM